MGVYDWILAVVALAFAVRGWRRGFVREVVDVVVLIVGLALVFRLSGPIGVVLGSMANVPYEAGRIVAGALLLIGLVVAATIIGRVITVALHILPGGSTLNRMGGAFVGVVYAAVLAVFATTMLGVVPLPDGARETVDAALDESVVAIEIMDPEGQIQVIVGSVSGDSVVQSVLTVRDAVGDRLIAGTLPIPLPGAVPADITEVPEANAVVLGELASARIAAGENPLVESRLLTEVATARARRVYLSGTLELDDGLSTDLVAAGVPGSFHTDAVVLGATPNGVAEALLSTPTYRDAIEGGEYSKVGIGILQGPAGLVGVIVLTP